MKASKILSFVLAVVFVFSALCVPVSAREITFMPVIKSGYIIGAHLKTPQIVFRELFGERKIKIYEGREEIPEDSDKNIGTGFSAQLDSYTFFTFVVMGDINGDGDLTSMDYVLVKRGVLGTYSMSHAEMRAADVDDGEELRAINYIKVKRAYFGTYDINKRYRCEPYESTTPPEDGWSGDWV